MEVKVLYRENTKETRKAWYEAEGARVRVSSRCKTVEEAEQWLRPKGVPPDALRQGEFFFVPAPTEEVGNPDELGWYAQTSQYSWRAGHWTRWRALDFRARHRPQECRVLITYGQTGFIGRGGQVRTHGWQGRPHVYVRGSVSHPEHGDLQLPAHERGQWYEVIPNKAHGPWRPRDDRFGGGID